MSFTLSVEYDLLPSITSFWSSLRACSWLCSFLTRCGSALFMPALAMLLSAAVGPLFYPLWVRSFSFFSSGSSICSRFWLHLELCSLPGVAVLRVRQSRPASTVHTVFCSVVPWFVKGLRCSLAVVMALHEPLTMALHGFPASLSDELFARPRADPRILFRTLLHVLRVWRALTSGWS